MPLLAWARRKWGRLVTGQEPEAMPDPGILDVEDAKMLRHLVGAVNDLMPTLMDSDVQFDQFENCPKGVKIARDDAVISLLRKISRLCDADVPSGFHWKLVEIHRHD